MSKCLLSMGPTVCSNKCPHFLYSVNAALLCAEEGTRFSPISPYSMCLMLQSLVSCRINHDNHSIRVCVHFVGGDGRRRKARRLWSGLPGA